MRHLNVVSRGRPAKAQFESLLQLVGLFSAVLAVMDQIRLLTKGTNG